MNTPKATLWNLINRMTPAEKRYFKTHFGHRHSRLTSLFDCLNKQEFYHEAAVREHLGVAASQFKVLKHQLQELVMKSLVANGGKRNLKSKIRLGLEEADILLERKLFEEAIRLLRRLEQQCSRYGLTLYQYEIRERLHQVRYLELDFSDAASGRHYDRLVTLQKVLQQKQRLSSIQQELDSFNPFTPKRREKLAALRHELFHMKAEHMDFPSSLAWMESYALCSELMGDEATAELYRQLLLDNFSESEPVRNNLPLSYLRALQQAAVPMRRRPEKELVEDLAQRAHRVITQYPQFSPHYVYFLWAKLRVYYLHHDWDRMLGSVERDCMHHLATHQLGGLRTALNMFLLLNVAHLIRGNYEQANHYLQAYRQHKADKELWMDYSVNLLELILLWERSELEQLTKRLQYFRRQLKTTILEDQSPLYTVHLRLFLQLLRDPFDSQQYASNVLLKMADYPYDPLLYYYSLLNIERWVQAMAAKQRWIDAV